MKEFKAVTMFLGILFASILMIGFHTNAFAEEQCFSSEEVAFINDTFDQLTRCESDTKEMHKMEVQIDSLDDYKLDKENLAIDLKTCEKRAYKTNKAWMKSISFVAVLAFLIL